MKLSRLRTKGTRHWPEKQVTETLLAANRRQSVKPGGWVEYQDCDGYGAHFLQRAVSCRNYDEVYGAFEKAGYDVHPEVKLEQWFKGRLSREYSCEVLAFPTASGQRITVLSVFPPFLSSYSR